MVIALIVVAAVLVLLIVWFIAVYNKLVGYRNRTDNAWHQIDVQLKRRFDLIPNLVETVKGYASHEKEVFEKVTQARAMVSQAGDNVAQRAQAENMVTGAAKTLFAVAVAYPDLKANQNFLMLQEELSGTESKIAFARQFYNDSVMGYDNSRQKFPGNLVAGMFSAKFTAKEYFEIEEPAEREAPKVQF